MFRGMISCQTIAATNRVIGAVVPNQFDFLARNFTASHTLCSLKSFDKRKLKSRKPKWKGRAPSKLETITFEPTKDPEEEKLLAEWNKQYMVDMDQVYALMKDKMDQSKLDTGAEKRWILEERHHHAKMIIENDEWNRKTGLIRERDYADQLVRDEEEVAHAISAALEEREAKREEAMVYVRQLQEESKHFVTLDNLDTKVREALDAEIVNYNFSLDKTGNIVTEEINSTLLN